MRRFRNRTLAGEQLGELVAQRLDRDPDVIVLGLPRGGVPVAVGVARALDAPLDVFVVRKLGLPGHEEFAMGAIASGGATVLNTDVIDRIGLSDATVEGVIQRERAELARREEAYRGERLPLDLAGKTVILVDDGIATGSSMQAAVLATKSLGPGRVIVATPTAPPDSVATLAELADDVIAVRTPEPFLAVGYWYDDFAQTTDGEVIDILASSGDE